MFSLSVLFVCLTITCYAILMLLPIFVIDFHKLKEPIICEVLVVTDSHVVSEKPYDSERRNITNPTSRGSERGSTQDILLKLLVLLRALSNKSLLRTRTQT